MFAGFGSVRKEIAAGFLVWLGPPITPKSIVGSAHRFTLNGRTSCPSWQQGLILLKICSVGVKGGCPNRVLDLVSLL